MLEKNYFDEIKELNFNDRKQCKKEEFKLKIKMRWNQSTKEDGGFDFTI